MRDVPALTRNDGRTIPPLGSGVVQIPQDETEAAATTALAAGYRLIDTAQGYDSIPRAFDASTAELGPRCSTCSSSTGRCRC